MGFFTSETSGFIIQTYIRKVLIKSGVFKRQYTLFTQYSEQLSSGPVFYSWPGFFFQQRFYPTATAGANRHYSVSWLELVEPYSVSLNASTTLYSQLASSSGDLWNHGFFRLHKIPSLAVMLNPPNSSYMLIHT